MRRAKTATNIACADAALRAGAGARRCRGRSAAARSARPARRAQRAPGATLLLLHCAILVIMPPSDPLAPLRVSNQALAFDGRVPQFLLPPPPEVEARLARVAAAAVPRAPAVGDATASLRVLDVGTGAGALVPHLLRAGATHVLGCDVSPAMVAAAARAHPPPGLGGNASGARFRCADVADLPAYEGPFDAATFNASFGNVHSQRDTLIATALLLRHGGCVVVSHPLGKAYVAKLNAEDAAIVPHTLPTSSVDWAALLVGLPLLLESLVDEADFYCAVLRLPRLYALPSGPRRLEASVVHGFGRGSRQMGVPTANLPPEELGEQLAGLARGVYYGWAWLAGEEGPRKAVLNIGRRPTFADGTGDTVEVHVMHDFGRDFYGERMRVLVLGFMRPELKFGGIADLVARIRADVGQGAALLDAPESAAAAEDPFLRGK